MNRFVTAPLPFGVEPVVPPAEIGVQLRGGIQFGKLGQDFDYTVWGGNGPNYSSVCWAPRSESDGNRQQPDQRQVNRRAFSRLSAAGRSKWGGSSSARPLTMASG